MTIKDVLKKDFADFDKIILKRFKSSKLIFAGFSLLFFLNYFFLSNYPENNILLYTLPIIYIGFIVSFLFITYYSLKIKFKKKINLVTSIVLIIFLVIIGIIFSLPFLIDSEKLSNLF